MANYKKMYLTLFNRVSDVIDYLQKAQQEAEETYMEAEKWKIPQGRRTQKERRKSKIRPQ